MQDVEKEPNILWYVITGNFSEQRSILDTFQAAFVSFAVAQYTSKCLVSASGYPF